MARRTLIALSLLLAVAAAHADTTNVAASASGGATAGSAASDKEAMFRSLDIDGDGFVSKAEAAGHESVTVGFDRADRNHDGKLSFAEYDSIGKPRPARKKTTRGPGSASAGATKKAN